MTRNTGKLLIAALTLAVLTLAGYSAVQVQADAGLLDAAPAGISETSWGNFCNGAFYECGQWQVCPGGCYCDTTRDICLE